MTFQTPAEILTDADARGLRRALVVTALPIEMRAVRAHLKELGSSSGRDGTIYECGQFSAEEAEWLVIVAECGAGNNPAQSVVTYAHIDFGKFETVLLVGVAGSRKSDAPIGSVIASNYVYSPYGGKYGPTGFSSRPHSLVIDNRLVQLARKVSRDEKWHGRIMSPLNGVLPATEDYPQPFPPGALIAPIVSVEAVAADPDSELERMIAEYSSDAHAIEMEGYGAVCAANAEQAPIIVIRGISDMTTKKTPKRDAIYQPVAAVHAAAFGFELLNLWGMTSGTTPRPVSTKPTPKIEPATVTAPVVQPTSIRLVLNFEGDAAAFTGEKINAILEAVRNATGNNAIRVVGSELGSFRLIIDAARQDLEILNTETFRAALAVEQKVELVSVLEESAYHRAQALQETLGPASQDLLAWPRNLPGGAWIDRPELAQLLRVIEDEQSSTTVLLGPPGSGKSALLSAFVAEVVERGWPVLGIKADLMDPQVQSEDDLQAYLRLPERPSGIIEHISELRPVVLVIDQLDALAGYLDLKTGRLNVLLSLIRRLGLCHNIHIVLSARTFEFEHDVRLRSVSAESITLNLPAWHTVLSLLEARGVQADGWPTDAQEVLRSPQALSTFLQLNHQVEAHPFHKYQEMLDRLWSERILRGADGPRLARLVSDIAERMAEEESLWLAAVRFEDQISDLRALEAKGILTSFGSESKIGFSHQTLFDHALARGFARGNSRLSDYVLARQTSLFVRPKLWAALTYLREVEPSRYEIELETIWSAQELRRHLRILLIDFIGQQPSPTDREAILMAGTLHRPTDRPLGLRALTGSPGWFERMAKSFIAEAMARDQSSANLCIGVLVPAWGFSADEVVTLIRERWAPDPAFDGQTWSVLEGCLTWNDDVLSLAQTILSRTDIVPFHVDHMVARVGVNQPDAALQLVRTRLSRDLTTARDESARRLSAPRPDGGDMNTRIEWELTHSPSYPLSKMLEDRRDWDSLPALAEAAPAAFLQVLWPWFQAVFAALRGAEQSREGSLGYAISHRADFRFNGEHTLGLPAPALLEALRTAAECLAADDPDAFLAWLHANETEDATPAQRLFAHALASQPERYAERSLEFLIVDPRRFHLGDIEDISGTTKRLVRTAGPFWTEEGIRRFEAAVNAYKPPPGSNFKNADGRRGFANTLRRIRLGLLKALPADRVSAETQRQIAEETRVFPDDKLGSRFSGVHTVGSTMEAEAMLQASDDDIINAFKALPDATGWDHPKRFGLGGNIQLSRAFAEFAKRDPERATRLITRFEPNFGERASSYALDAMAEASDGPLIMRLFSELVGRGFAGEEFRSSAAQAIERLIRRDVSVGDDIVAILERWLAQPGGTEGDEDGEETAEDIDTGVGAAAKDDDEEPRSILWDNLGFTTLPHGNYPVLEALTRILLARPDHDRLAEILQAHLSRPENPKVWQALLQFFVYLKPAREEVRLIILKRLFEQFPELSRSREAVQILAHAQWWAPDYVREILIEWSTAAIDPFLAQAYGELVALIAIVQPDLGWATRMLEQLVEDPASGSARVGATFSAVNLWKAPGRRSASAQLLISLIPMADRRTWSAIFDLFRLVDELTPDQDTVGMLNAMAEHLPAAGNLSATFVVERLETLLPHEAPLVGKIAQELVANWRGELGDMRTGTVSSAPQLVDLAITLHRLGPSTREMGTSLFEDLLLIDAYSARQTLDEIDGRFNEVRRPVRPRLPRRSAQRRKGRATPSQQG